ncbi:MAG: peptidoglycan bridge formation glycyltransferase FemA/FemB family protein [Patescibacteria group bacterium]
MAKKFTVKKITNKDAWEKFVLKNKPQSFLHSWNWGEINNELGSKIIRLGFYESSKLVGVVLLIKQNAKRGSHFLVPGGPIIDWNNKSLVSFCIKSIKELGKQEKVWFIRVRPELLDTDQNKKLFSKFGFVSAPMHLHAENTWILDISKSEEEILKEMRKTTRYLIKKSLNESLEFEFSKSPNDSPILAKLQDETAKRHKFIGFSEKLFKHEIEKFADDDQGGLFYVKKGNEILAATIIVFYGHIGYYHHSGSVSGNTKIPFSYFLQWRVIQEAKKRGCTHYNFWGVAPNDNPKHRFAGVSLFKKGFGGEQIDWLHAQDLPLSSLYWSTYIFESIRKKLRRL